MALSFHGVGLALCVGALAACGSSSAPDPSNTSGGSQAGGSAGVATSAGTAGASAGQAASGGAPTGAGTSGALGGFASGGTGGSSVGGSSGSAGANAMAGAAGSGGSATGGGGAGAGGATCQKGQVRANEVLWIGDSWIEIPGSQHTTVRDLARAAGALGQSEDYVDKAVSGSPIATIIKQYTDYQAGATKVKVLLMDGGGIDVMQRGKTQASVDGVVDKVKAHLAKVKTDGTVQHIIYYTYPQLPASGPGQDVGPKLQPGLQAACEASAVPCHYLYLEPLFAGHPEYIGSDSLHPSDSGGKVIAQAVWDIMKKHCIAQ